jgi:hypothetical protein
MEIIMIRIIAAGTLLATSLAGSSAFAQGDYTHHTVCLIHGSSTECAYDSVAQCEASKHNPTDSCQPNSGPINHR